MTKPAEEATATDAPYLTEAVRRLPLFRPPLSWREAVRGAGRDAVHVLSLNECPYPPSPRVVEAIGAAAADANRYPVSRGGELTKALAERTGVPPERIVFGNGSDELLHLLCVIALRPGDNAVMPTPSFPRYRLATALMGAEPRLVRLGADGANDADGLLARVDGRTRLLFCCNPNNPSGGFLDESRLARLVEAAPADVLLVVDEAYYEFGREVGLPDALALLARRRGPWAVTRTFSKAYALAGLRIGYCLAGSVEVAAALFKAKANYNVNALALAGALAALGDEAHVRFILDSCARERARLAAGVRALGFRPLPSAANFVSFDVGGPAEAAMAALREQGVLVREWRDPGYETFVRATVGTPADTAATLKALSRLNVRPGVQAP
jgi:histidinol-phosphate aminotransferase